MDILSNKQKARFIWVNLDSCNGGYVPQSSNIDLDRQKEKNIKVILYYLFADPDLCADKPLDMEVPWQLMSQKQERESLSRIFSG